MPEIPNLKVAILATDGFEQVELTEPMKALKAGLGSGVGDRAGARTDPGYEPP